MQLFPNAPVFRRIALTLLTAFSGIAVQAASAANITVASPVNGTSSSTSVWVRAHNIGCNGLTPTAFGFSLDSSSTTTMGVTAYDIDVTHYAVSAGKHTIHFKSWTKSGICPAVTTTFTAGGSSSTASTSSTSTSTAQTSSSSSASTSASIPSNAASSSDLDTMGGWTGEHDAGTPGSAKGSTAYPATTPVYDDARKFYMTYSGHGGERWHISFGKDANATHFVLDTYVFVVNPTQLGNLELDLNQVIPNGKTVIYGTQCSVYSHSWEWTYYASGGFHWHTSNVACNPQKWSANTWHHLQLGFHRDSNGVVTHDWVSVDGTKSTFSGATSNSASSLGWAGGTLLMNVQPDGASTGSGSVTMFFHKTTFYRW